MAWRDLAEFINNDLLPHYAQDYKGSQEEYLRSLLAVVNQYQQEPATCDLLIAILKQSFATAPPPFDRAWLTYTEPPFSRYAQEPPYQVVLSDFEFLQRTLLFQIADLRRMSEENQINDLAWFGVVSPTGHSWYNFHPYSLLECAMSGIIDNMVGQECVDGECSWNTLADILEMGRIYE